MRFQAAPGGGTHQQGPDQARPGSIGQSINIRCCNTRFINDLTYQRQQLANMVAGGQLRDHAAIFGMQLHLAVQGMAQQACVASVNGHAGFITGGLDSKHAHGPNSKRRGLLHKEILPFQCDVYRMRNPIKRA